MEYDNVSDYVTDYWTLSLSSTASVLLQWRHDVNMSFLALLEASDYRLKAERPAEAGVYVYAGEVQRREWRPSTQAKQLGHSRAV